MFSKTAKKLSTEDIKEVETKLNLKLPPQIVAHYMKFNGGIPDKAFYYSSISDIELSLSTFLPIKHNDDLNSTLEEKYLFFKDKGFIPAKFLPFAIDWGGNLCCLNIENGQVLVVWLDIGEINENAIQILANNFNDFINNLEDDDC